MVIVRPAQADDSHRILQLFHELDALHADGLPSHFQLPSTPQLTPVELEQAMTDHAKLVLLAEVDQQVVGIVFAEIDEEPPSDTSIHCPRRFGWIRKLVVTTAAQRQGVGTALMRAAEQWAIDQRLATIEFIVWAFNQAACDFYRSLGYEPLNYVLSKSLEL